MPNILCRATVPLILAAALPASALEIQTQPNDHVYANRLEGRSVVHDLVLHGVRVHNDGSEPVLLEWIELRAEGEEGRRLVRRVTAVEARAGEAEIAPGGELVFGPLYMAAEFAASSLTVVAHTRASNGAAEASVALPVRTHRSSVRYGFPLRGTWYMRGIPSALSHHRWTTATEFAVDFFKTDATGNISSGEFLDPTSYYGYGADVLAAADGVVERVIHGMRQDRAARERRQGEGKEDYARRMGELNQRAQREHGLGGATGNLVVLRHANGERTAYGHLKTGSLEVGEGDPVTRGQKLAEVGDTGDSPAAHLHFQVMEADAMRSVPFQFDDVRIRSREYGSWAEPN